MPIFNEDVQIIGLDNEAQLTVQGSATQSQPVQRWQTSAGTPLADVTADGRLRVGGDLGGGTPNALVEANKTVTLPTTMPKQGVQARGLVDGGAAPVREPIT